MTKQQQEVVFDNMVAEMRKVMLGKVILGLVFIWFISGDKL